MKLPASLLPWAAQMPDERAMLDVQERADPAAFARLVSRWQEPIRRLCARMTGDEHRGEDLAQEAFARVFINRHQFLPNRKFSTWLWRIAINLCHEEARRKQVRQFLPLGECSSEEIGPDDQAIEDERSVGVRAALAALPENLRIVVVLREYEGLKFREIAEVIDAPESTVKSRMANALAQLSRELKAMVEPKEIDAPHRTASER